MVVARQVLQEEVRRSDKVHLSDKVRRLDKCRSFQEARSFLQELHSGLLGQVGQQVRRKDNKASVGCRLQLLHQTATTACLSNSGFGQ